VILKPARLEASSPEAEGLAAFCAAEAKHAFSTLALPSSQPVSEADTGARYRETNSRPHTGDYGDVDADLRHSRCCRAAPGRTAPVPSHAVNMRLGLTYKYCPCANLNARDLGRLCTASSMSIQILPSTDVRVAEYLRTIRRPGACDGLPGRAAPFSMRGEPSIVARVASFMHRR